MLYYSEVALSPLEVPGESSICIYISGCQNHCNNCHYPELQQADYGDPLMDNLSNILALYFRQATCVCFMGEGQTKDQEQLIEANDYALQSGFKTCLYSGRDLSVKNWMSRFNYLKLGSYREDRGPLHVQTTNQSFYRKTQEGFEDITYVFWD